MNGRKLLLGVAFATLSVAGTAQAATCDGFTDVQDTDSFCDAVQWLKNRSITLGCDVAQYCPSTPVTRASMALFMNRLGNALEPTFIHAIQSGAASVVNANGVMCQTAPYDVTSYPRVATASTMAYHRSASSVIVTAQAKYSLDSGATWLGFGDFVTASGNVVNQYGAQSPVAKPLYLSPGQTVIFGINASGSSTNDAGCELTVRIDSHSGASAPFDTLPEAARSGLQASQ